MPLRSKLFTLPGRMPELEACLVRDASHITPGGVGHHVKKIQRALNRLSAGIGRPNFRLKVDGIYGPKTTAAVQAYKNAPSRPSLHPLGQADPIVGKGTIRSLDDEMDILENESSHLAGLISSFGDGAPHNHAACPMPPRVTGTLFDGHASHHGTPLNPKRTGRMVNIYGEGETDYLGFTDFATESRFANGRPLTSTLPKGCASDICMRSAPINQTTHDEIKRLARPMANGGCRFTYASNQATFAPPRPLILSLGPVIQQAFLQDSDHPDDPKHDLEVWVIEII